MWRLMRERRRIAAHPAIPCAGYGSGPAPPTVRRRSSCLLCGSCSLTGSVCAGGVGGDEPVCQRGGKDSSSTCASVDNSWCEAYLSNGITCATLDMMSLTPLRLRGGVGGVRRGGGDTRLFEPRWISPDDPAATCSRTILAQWDNCGNDAVSQIMSQFANGGITARVCLVAAGIEGVMRLKISHVVYSRPHARKRSISFAVADVSRRAAAQPSYASRRSLHEAL